MSRGDLYQLLLMVEGKGILTIFLATHDDAEQRGRRMVEAERKKGVDMTMHITRLSDIDEVTRQAFIGKSFNLVSVER